MKDTIVMYPSPQKSHLISLLELAKLMLQHHPSSLTITIIVPSATTSPETDSYIDVVSATEPSITFIRLPTLTFPSPSSPQDQIASWFEIPMLHNTNLRQALLNLSNIKAFVTYFFCSAAFHVTSSLSIPTYYFFSCAGGVSVFLYTPTIYKNFTQSLKDIETVLDIPGVPPIPSKEMPLLMSDGSHKIHNYFLETAKLISQSSGIILNTFESLEKRAIEALEEGKCTPDLGHPLPPIYCVGPVINTEGKKQQQQHECLTWLDKQPSRSVVFLCFGTLGTFSSKQLKEIASGLERSGVRFLWVVRSPNQTEPNQSLESILPEGFLERTQDRGLAVKSWAPQDAIINHGAVGGFVTHCGWKSALEAVHAGVPMLAWPLYAEQKLSKIFLVEECKVAFPLDKSEDGMVSAEEIEKRVTELMNSEKRRVVWERSMALREASLAAMTEGGSSRISLTKLMHSFRANLTK